MDTIALTTKKSFESPIANAPFSPVRSPVQSRFLRALNYFGGEPGEAPINNAAAPSPVVVIHDDGSGDAESPLLDDIEVPEIAAEYRWRQRLLSMDGIELPSYDDLDSLPPSGDVRTPCDLPQSNQDDPQVPIAEDGGVLRVETTSDGPTSLEDVLPPSLYSMLAGLGPATDSGSRGPGVKLAPGWKPLRSGVSGTVGGQAGDCNFEAGGDQTGATPSDSGEVEGNEVGMGMGEAMNESGDSPSRPALRTPRHDSIIEGFGQFINEHVVLDSAFAEPDFKALSESDDVSPPSPDQPDDCADEQELKVEDPPLQEVPETLAVAVDSARIALDTSEICAHETGEGVGVEAPLAAIEAGEEPAPSMEELAGDNLLRVVPLSEIDPDEIVLAAVVAPSLLEDDPSALSELAIAGLSSLRSDTLGNEAGRSLLEDLGSEVPNISPEQECLSATLEEAPVFPGAADDGFSSGNAALIRHGVSCPGCEQELRIQNRYVAIEGRCPACTVMIVAHRQPDGSVVANLAETDSPKFLQQPDIGPQGEPGGMSLSYGGSASLKTPASVQQDESDGGTSGEATMARALIDPFSISRRSPGDWHDAGDGAPGNRSRA